MKFKFLYPILLISFVLLFQSCATLIYGPEHYLKIRCNQDKVKLKIVGGEVDSLNNRIILRKITKNPNIEISKLGYEMEIFKFNRVKKMAISTYNVTTASIGSALIFGGGIYHLINSSTSSISGYSADTRTGGVLATIGAAIVLPTIIDGISKSSSTFLYDSLNIELTPLVKKANADSVSQFDCNSVSFQLKNGALVGKSYRTDKGKKIFLDDLSWNNETNASFSDLKNEINAELTDLAYISKGLPTKNAIINYKYSLICEVNNLNIDRIDFLSGSERIAQTGNMVMYKMNYLSDYFCNMTTKWSLINNLTNQPAFEETINSSSFVNKETQYQVIKKTLIQSLKKLLINKEFVKVVRKQTLDVTTSNFLVNNNTTEKIFLEKVFPKNNLPEVIESAITIDLGNNGHGSGFIISKDGYAITNYHVVGDIKTVNVILSNGLTLQANVVRANETRDVALLKISGSGFKALSINNDKPLIGANIIAIGTPGKKELGQTVSKGIISGKREIEDKIFLQTDINISPGSSGGPIVNDKNEVIGIITSKLIGQGVEGIGFAIPISEVFEKLGLEIK